LLKLHINPNHPIQKPQVAKRRPARSRIHHQRLTFQVVAKIEQQATDLDGANIQLGNLKKGINLIWLYNNFTELNIIYLFSI